MICPRCEQQEIIRNGKIHNGKQRYKCKNCGRPLVANPQNCRITEETKKIIANCLLEKVSLRGIHRITGVAVSWIQEYSHEIHRQALLTPLSSNPSSKKSPLTIECDEMWSYVGNKASQSWIWLALDVASRQIVGYTVGQCDQREALRLWQSLPPVYRPCAVGYTDNWKAYRGVLPKTRHRIVGTNTGKTNHLERFNNTLRQRISRLARKTLAFSKKLENHLGAIAYFIHHYNLSLL